MWRPTGYSATEAACVAGAGGQFGRRSTQQSFSRDLTVDNVCATLFWLQVSVLRAFKHLIHYRNVMLGWEELPNKNFPIIFHPVYGKDEREENSPSFFNVAEVETIERYLKKLLDDNVRSRGLKHLRPEMIGVISPYKRQVKKMCLYSSYDSDSITQATYPSRRMFFIFSKKKLFGNKIGQNEEKQQT